jgi:D-tyrosyl-tRNA(Tyr) deacylase
MRALALTLFSMASSSFVRNFPTASITALRSYSSNVLLVATTVDEASNNIAQALKASCCNWKTWSSSKDSSILSVSALNYKVCTSVADETSVVWLWIQDKPLLHMNNVDKLFNEQFLTSELEADRDSRGVSFDEVLFLSKHCAASGKASLTVHPIGELRE